MSLMTIWGFSKEEVSRAVGILRDEKQYLDHKDAVEKVQTTREAKKAPKGKRGPAMKPSEFWRELHLAQMNLKQDKGSNWHLDASTYVWGRVPKRLSSQKGQATTHRWNRDAKIPLAKYWPYGSIPNIGIEFARSN